MDENLSKVCVEEKVAAFEQGRTTLFHFIKYLLFEVLGSNKKLQQIMNDI